MDHPQTAAAVPAPGVDPTVEELGTIQSLAGIGAWLGAPDALTVGLIAELGGGAPRLREIVFVPKVAWEQTAVLTFGGRASLVPGSRPRPTIATTRPVATSPLRLAAEKALEGVTGRFSQVVENHAAAGRERSCEQSLSVIPRRR